MRVRRVIKRLPYRALILALGASLIFIAGGLTQTLPRAPKVIKRVLLNGLPILAAEQHQAPQVTVRLLIKSGSAFDPIAKGGLADMTAEMLKAGTQQRSRARIAEELANQGLTLRTEVDWDATYIIGQGPAQQAARILDLLADLVLNPAFPESEFNQFKAQRLERLKQQREDPAILADQVFEQKLFEKTTYGRPRLGTPASVSGITLKDVKEFYQKFYRPNNAALAIVGDTDPNNVLRLAGRKIGGWIKGDVPPFTFLRPQAPGATRVYLIDQPDLSMASMRIGHLGIARDNDDYFAVRLLAQIFMTRELPRLATPRPGAAGPSSSPSSTASGFHLDTRRLPGPLVLALSDSTERVSVDLTEAIAAMRRMKESLTDKDLDEAKSALINRYAAHTQTADQIAARLLEIDLYQLGSNYIDTYAARVQRVTPDEVRRAAERYFDPGAHVIVVVGNAAALKEPLQKFGPVTLLSRSAVE